MLLVFIPLMGDYITATVLGGAKGNMVGQLVASQFQTAQNWALGSAMAVLLIIVIMATVARCALIAWLVSMPFRARNRLVLGARRRRPTVDPRRTRAATGAARDLRSRGAAVRRTLLVVGCLADGVEHRWSSSFLFAPIIVIIVSSFNVGRLLVSWDGVRLRRRSSRSSPSPRCATRCCVSIQTGAIAAVVATALGTLAGIAMARRPGKWVIWFIALLLLVSVTPEIVDAVALLPWLVFLGQDLGLTIFNDGIVRLVVGHSLFADSGGRVHRACAARRPRRTARGGIRRPLREAVHDVPPGDPAAGDAGGARRAFLLSFTLSLDNTVIAAFVQVSGTTPWPVYVFSALRSGLRPEIAAVSTLMLAADPVALAARRAGAQACRRFADPDRTHD